MASRFVIAARKFSTSVPAAKLVRPPIQIFGIEGRYAHALYSAASKQKQLETVEKELKTVEGLMAKDDKMIKLMEDPTIKRSSKSEQVTQLLQNKSVSPMTQNLFAAMAENGRLNRGYAVIRAFDQIMQSHRGEVACTVTTAKPLDASSLKELKTVLEGFLKKGEVLVLSTKVDPNIIGGMKVNLGDSFLDMSMATKIKKFTELINVPV